jgi:hypothetical protein
MEIRTFDLDGVVLQAESVAQQFFQFPIAGGGGCPRTGAGGRAPPGSYLFPVNF